MMDNQEIIEALESTSGNRRDRGGMSDPRMPDVTDIRLWRDRLLRFFEDLDADVTVREIVEALEDYA